MVHMSVVPLFQASKGRPDWIDRFEQRGWGVSVHIKLKYKNLIGFFNGAVILPSITPRGLLKIEEHDYFAKKDKANAL